MLSFIDHTPERLPHNSERQAHRRGHARYDQRPDSMLRHFHREYARSDGRTGRINLKRQYRYPIRYCLIAHKESVDKSNLIWYNEPTKILGGLLCSA